MYASAGSSAGRIGRFGGPLAHQQQGGNTYNNAENKDDISIHNNFLTRRTYLENQDNWKEWPSRRVSIKTPSKINITPLPTSQM